MISFEETGVTQSLFGGETMGSLASFGILIISIKS